MDQSIFSQGINIGHWVEKWAFLRPNKIAILCEDATFTYRQLNERVDKLISFLHKMGIRKGDRVAVLLANSNVYIEAFFAISRMGAILVPLNFRLARPEMEFIIRDSGSETMIFEAEFTNLIASIKPNIPIKAGNYICVGEAIPLWSINYEKALEEMPVGELQVNEFSGGEDPHIIMYTSGTTGVPKGAVLSHRKTFYNVLNADIYYGLTPDDIFLISRPLFHSGGLIVGSAPMLYKGGTIILKKRFRPCEILETIQRYRVTVIEAAATMYKFILDQCEIEKYDLSSLRCCFTGGERVPTSLLKDFQKRGILISQIYGQTETSTITWLPPQEAARKLGSVGVPVFHGQVKIINKNGSKVKPGEAGEIIVSGPILMTGYWGKPELTEGVTKEGWLHTGDLATMDEEGFWYIVDREKDMFISGGENVYPAEIEKMFLETPKIADVAIVGVPDEKWGEVGMAVIVLTEGQRMTEEEALRFCEGRIAKYKIPKIVRFLDELPKTAAQKIMRYKLREDYLKQKDN